MQCQTKTSAFLDHINEDRCPVVQTLPKELNISCGAGQIIFKGRINAGDKTLLLCWKNKNATLESNGYIETSSESGARRLL